MKKMFALALMATGVIFAQDMRMPEEKKTEERAIQQPVSEFIPADEQVKNTLKKNNHFMGYDQKKKLVIQIGTAVAYVDDPANDDNFQVICSAKALEAYLEAKAKIIASIDSEFDAMDRAEIFAQFGDDDVSKTFKKMMETYKSQDDDLKKEEEQLKGLWDTKKSKEVTPEARAKKEEIKMRREQLKAKYEELKKMSKEIPKVPKYESKSAVKLLAKMPLLGAIVVTQSESWNPKTKAYSVSMALAWSRKLQEDALSLLNGAEISRFVGQEGDLRTWIDNQNLAVMIGPRRFIDKDGHVFYLGIGRRDMKVVSDITAKRKLADAEARKAVAFSLIGDVEVFEEAKQHYKEFDKGARSSIEQLNTVVTEKCNMKLKGVLQLEYKNLIHPISMRDTYVTVFYADPRMSEDIAKILAEENQKLNTDHPAESKKTIPVSDTSDSKVKEGTRKSQGGTFTGDRDINWNF